MAEYNLRIETPSRLVSGDIVKLPARYGSQTGGTFPLELPKGEYLLEAWGSAGSSVSADALGGRGGYASGILSLSSKTMTYLTAGSQGTNGGSTVYNPRFRTGGVSSGGASDIRLNANSMLNRVIVAGGGGGDGTIIEGTISEDRYGRRDTFRPRTYSVLGGGDGGGASGVDGEPYYVQAMLLSGRGGTPTAGGLTGMARPIGSETQTDGTFGYGGEWTGNFDPEAYRYIYGPGAPGGGGWYGGGGGGWYEYQSGTHRVEYFGAGGGGSGFTFTEETAASVPNHYALDSTYYLSSTSLAQGMNSGEGFITITVLSVFNGIYIGSSAGKALAVKGIYIGDSNGKAKRVIKGYIGDSNGKAKRFL